MVATSSPRIESHPSSPLFHCFSPTSDLSQPRLCGAFGRGGWSGAYAIVFWGSEVVLWEEDGFEVAVATMARAVRRCLFGAKKEKRCLHGAERCNEA